MVKNVGKKSDFCLCELSHLTKVDFFFDHELVKAKLKSLLLMGKKTIEAETRPGDLVLLEGSYKLTYETFLKLLGKRNSPKLLKIWKNGIMQNQNFYYELRQYAERNGRIVESLETSPFIPRSRFSRRIAKFSAETSERLLQIVGPRRNLSFETKIRRAIAREVPLGKKILAIVSESHATYLEEKMRPRKVIWHGPSLPVIEEQPLTRTQVQRLRRLTALQRRATAKAKKPFRRTMKKI